MELNAKPILKMGNPQLRRIAELIRDPLAPEIRELVETMKLSMAAASGVGLAAPQIGVNKRLVIFEVPGARLEAEDGVQGAGVPQTVLINPVITPMSTEMASGWEGCLSVPGLRGLVPRHTQIRYQGIDLSGNLIDREVQGFHARVVQHEVDHLDGILYPERMTNLQYLIFQSEMPAFMEALNS